MSALEFFFRSGENKDKAQIDGVVTEISTHDPPHMNGMRYNSHIWIIKQDKLRAEWI
jgi:hypothetical protein